MLVLAIFFGSIQADERPAVQRDPSPETLNNLNADVTGADAHSATPRRIGFLDSFVGPSESTTLPADAASNTAWFRRQSVSHRNSNEGIVYTGQSNELNSSLVRLVSLETDPNATITSADADVPGTPIYEMQQPCIQHTEGTAFAGPSATRGAWFLIAPYGWISGMNGQVGVGSHVANIDLTPGQVLAHLGSIDGALMLHTEMGKGNWGFILDANLIRASTSVTTLPAQVDVTLRQTLLEALGMYRLVDTPGYLVEGKPMTVDFLGGVRYYEFGNALTIRPFDPTLPTIPANLTATWVDLVIGGRARVPVTDSFDIFGRADIGGFGIGDSSTLAWNLIAGGDYKLNSTSSLIAGYRELNINRSGGVAGTSFEFNAKLYGPFLALAFQF